jgi:hypothetical protein
LAPSFEPRLQRRYRQPVLEHLHTGDPLAAGIHALALPELAGGFAAVLSAHRFPHIDTAPALLAGPWVLLAMLEALDHHTPEELHSFKKLLLGGAEEESG